MEERNFNENVIRELQNMLRVIGRTTGDDILIIPENGIIDDSTERALLRFKYLYGLDNNSIVDGKTYAKILDEYNEAISKIKMTAPIRPYPQNESYELSIGEVSELVYILQLMLNALRLYYDLPRMPVNGSFGDETERAVKLFQRINSIPQTGIVDRITWNKLAEEYNNTVNDIQ